MAAADANSRGTPRIAVVTTQFGIPSEIWMVRQLRAFRVLRPSFLAFGPAGFALPDIETGLLDAGDPRRLGPFRRIARRLGLAAAHIPSAADRRRLKAQILGTGAEAVLVHFAWNAIPVIAALDGALPVVVHVHGRDVSVMLRDPAYRAALAATLPRADHLVAVGRFQLDRLAPFGLPPDHSLIPCGAPLALFAQEPLPLRQPGEPIRFLSVGRLNAEKGVLETLLAFERLLEHHPAAELTFIGDGPLAPDLEQRARASTAARNVRLLGLLGPEEIAAELAASHVFLQHSRVVDGWEEGFGVTLTEAGAAGLALVASRTGGIPDQLEDGVNGLLFPPDDVVAQAEAMLRLAENEPLRAQMGANARDVARRYDSDLMAARLEQVLLGVIRKLPAPA